MRNVITTLRSLPKRTSGLIAMIAAAIIVPATLLAWGPNRPTYTIEQPADHITFNSITNNPNIGDERNFVSIREKGTSGPWQDNQNVERGKEYVVRMYVHNNAAANLNLVAENTTAMFTLPTTTGKSIQVNGFLSASNAQPNEVYDHATFTGSEIFNLAYVPGTLLYENNAPGAGFSIPESVFTSNGAKLGYLQMDGKIPGCFQYAGYLTFVVKPQFSPETPVQNFTMQKLVSKHGENKWVETYNAQPGETVDFLLEYKNTGTVQQNNVTFSDKLPAHMSYVAGSTTFGNSKLPNGAAASDNIANGVGVNVGHYAPDANAWLIFSAKVDAKDKLKCGKNTLQNRASVTPEGQTQKEDDATVVVSKECVQPEPIKVCELASKKIIAIDKKDFDSSKHSMNLEDCKTVIPKPEVVEVCRLSDKQIVKIQKNQYDAKVYSFNMNDCKTPHVVNELPTTGLTGDIVSLVGAGSLVAASAYYIASRRSIGR